MKVGAENRKVLIAAVVLAVVALVFAVRMVLVLTDPAAAAAPATGQKGPQARVVRRGAPAKLPASNSLDPTLKLELLKSSESTEYKGSGRNIFAYKQVYIPPPIENVVKGPKCPGDPGCAPPPPPPIPLRFYGFASKTGEPKKIFLSSKETGDLFVAGEGEIVNRRYRVLHIGVNSVEIEDVLSNNRQTIPLTQG